MSAITDPEAVDRCAELSEHEATVRRGLRSLIETGAALQRIRDGRLYEARGYSGWTRYLQDQWGWTSGRARQIMRGAALAERALASGTRVPPNERQARH